MLKLIQIKIDGGTQQRAEICTATVDEYAEAYMADAEMPPVAVMFDGIDHWLMDGFHRYHAARKAGMTHIDADITHGTRREAIMHSVGVNVAHGLKRTNADKRKAVQTLLDDPEWRLWSNEAIAKACAVSPHTVAELKSISANAEMQVVKFERKGKVHQQATANIGRGSQAKESQPAEEEVIPPEPEYSIADETNDAIDILRDEISRLNDRLAMGAVDATDEEKQLIHVTLAELREENRQLQINLKAVTLSRDQYMNENAEMKKQIKMMQKQMKKVGI